MAHYNSKFPKRHHAWSNSREIRLFDMGVLCREYQRKLATLGVKSSKTYVSGGKKKYVGTKHLKGSESGPWCVSIFCNTCQPCFLAWASCMHMDGYKKHMHIYIYMYIFLFSLDLCLYLNRHIYIY